MTIHLIFIPTGITKLCQIIKPSSLSIIIIPIILNYELEYRL